MSSPRTTGWEAYRYGRSDQPKKPIPPIFSQAKREHLIQRIFDAVQDWRFSPFQYEGRTRHSLRTALCLAGYGWERSDAEAAHLVAGALKGHPRPSYNEGQPSYTASVVVCRGCGGGLDEYEISNGIRFCCEECRRMHQNRATGLSQGFIELGPTKCDNPKCRKLFYPRTVTSRYCSQQCSNEGRGLVLPEKECGNPECGKTFQPANVSADYCSEACNQRVKTLRKGERRLEARQDAKCLFCGGYFTPKKAGAKYCSEKHQKRAAYLREKATKAAMTNPDSAVGKLFDQAA